MNWAWWIILYYSLGFAVLFLGTRLDKRYPAGSVQRNRAELALCCAWLALPTAPLIYGIGCVIWHYYWHYYAEPPGLVIEAIVAFNLALALFLGGLSLIAKWRGTDRLWMAHKRPLSPLRRRRLQLRSAGQVLRGAGADMRRWVCRRGR